MVNKTVTDTKNLMNSKDGITYENTARVNISDLSNMHKILQKYDRVHLGLSHTLIYCLGDLRSLSQPNPYIYFLTCSKT